MRWFLTFSQFALGITVALVVYVQAQLELGDERHVVAVPPAPVETVLVDPGGSPGP